MGIPSPGVHLQALFKTLLSPWPPGSQSGATSHVPGGRLPSSLPPLPSQGSAQVKREGGLQQGLTCLGWTGLIHLPWRLAE